MSDQEELLGSIFDELGKKFRRLDRENDAEVQEVILLDITQRLQQAKTLIKDFEREVGRYYYCTPLYTALFDI